LLDPDEKVINPAGGVEARRFRASLACLVPEFVLAFTRSSCLRFAGLAALLGTLPNGLELSCPAEAGKPRRTLGVPGR